MHLGCNEISVNVQKNPKAVTQAPVLPEAVYVVLSTTPYKMGSFIRLVTHNNYNHVSIATTLQPSKLYSFARRYQKAPFCGGFVEETPVRYMHNGLEAWLKIRKLPLTREQALRLQTYLEEMYSNQDQYLYNMVSAALAPLGVKKQISRAYTCVEFVTEALAVCGVAPRLDPRRYYSIADLDRLLDGEVVYQGRSTEAFQQHTCPREPFLAPISPFFRTRSTLTAMVLLALRLVGLE